MKKIFSLFCLLLAASVAFLSYSRNDDNNAVTDEGVLIGNIDGVPIRWATRNVAAPGTFASTPESVGMFFQWNRSQGRTVGSDIAGNNTLAEGTEWTRANDPCPQGWRVPTREELTALHDADSEWTNRNGVYGRYFGTAPHRIFLPAAESLGMDGSLHYNPRVGPRGFYWSSTQGSRTGIDAWFLRFQSSSTLVGGGGARNAEFTIRCVAE